MPSKKIEEITEQVELLVGDVKETAEKIKKEADSKTFDEHTEQVEKDFESFRNSAEELLKAMAQAGLGLLNLAKDRFDKSVADFVDINKVKNKAQSEVSEVVDEFQKESESFKGNIESKLRNVSNNLREKLDIPSRDEFKKLKKRVKALEKEIASLEKGE